MPNIKTRINRLKRLWDDLMGQYEDTVFPHGFNDVPPAKSRQANEIMNHAENVRKEYEQLERKAGIIPKKKRLIVAKEISIEGIKDQPLEWGIAILAKAIEMPKAYMTARMIVSSLEFLENVEQDKKLAITIADSPVFVRWYQERYRKALLYCISSVRQLQIEGSLVDWSDKFLFDFMNSGVYKGAYEKFKDEHFGGGQMVG